jgi:hypothetical protein
VAVRRIEILNVDVILYAQDAMPRRVTRAYPYALRSTAGGDGAAQQQAEQVPASAAKVGRHDATPPVSGK